MGDKGVSCGSRHVLHGKPHTGKSNDRQRKPVDQGERDRVQAEVVREFVSEHTGEFTGPKVLQRE